MRRHVTDRIRSQKVPSTVQRDGESKDGRCSILATLDPNYHRTTGTSNSTLHTNIFLTQMHRVFQGIAGAFKNMEMKLEEAQSKERHTNVRVGQTCRDIIQSKEAAPRSRSKEELLAGTQWPTKNKGLEKPMTQVVPLPLTAQVHTAR